MAFAILLTIKYMRNVNVYIANGKEFKCVGQGPTLKSDKMLEYHTRQAIKNKIGHWVKVIVREA